MKHRIRLNIKTPRNGWSYAGGGPVKHRTEILLTSPYESDEPDNPRFNTVIPWLVRETIERSATIYREFLYDPQTEEFIFCYQRVAGYNEPKEQRLYFDKGRLIKAVPASMDEVWMEPSRRWSRPTISLNNEKLESRRPTVLSLNINTLEARVARVGRFFLFKIKWGWFLQSKTSQENRLLRGFIIKGSALKV